MQKAKKIHTDNRKNKTYEQTERRLDKKKRWKVERRIGGGKKRCKQEREGKEVMIEGGKEGRIEIRAEGGK